MRGDRRRNGFAAAWLVLCGLLTIAACIGLMLWRDPAFASAPAFAPSWPTVALNAIPVLLVLLVLLGITGRPLLSAWLILLMLWIVYYINTLKLTELNTPLMPGDLLLMSNLGQHGALLLARYLPQDAKHFLEAAVAILVAVLLIWKEPAVLRGWRRLALAAGAAAIAATLIIGLAPWNALYRDDQPGFHVWTPRDHALRAGLFAHLLRFGWETNAPLPDPDRAAARALLAYHANVDEPAEAPSELPDIIVLQSESFFDAARLRGLDPDAVLPSYRALAAVSRHGDLYVPTFGGGTIRTEFEVLTGIAMRYFPATLYPYFRLTATPVPSLASTLAARGYRCIAVHPHERSFWNRAAALANLGFGEFDGIEAFRHAPRQGYYTSDDALIDYLLKRLDTSDAPTFLFAISMENHGPYANFPNADEARRDAEPIPAGLSSDAARTLRGYLYHAEDADRALGRLADALRARHRRALLLFYGDHLPALPDVYAEAGFDDHGIANEEPVPWLLFDTRDVAPHASVDTASFYLPALLLDAAGIDDHGYFRTLESVRRDDRVVRGWIPAEDQGLSAIMQLRQRGEFRSAEAGAAPVHAVSN